MDFVHPQYGTAAAVAFSGAGGSAQFSGNELGDRPKAYCGKKLISHRRSEMLECVCFRMVSSVMRDFVRAQ